jgi:hypothetical protein
MPQTKLMSLHDKLQLKVKSLELEKQGKFDEAKKLERQIPLAPHLAKFAKKYMGTDFLVKSGWNLSEAEAEFGKDWLAQ